MPKTTHPVDLQHEIIVVSHSLIRSRWGQNWFGTARENLQVKEQDQSNPKIVVICNDVLEAKLRQLQKESALRNFRALIWSEDGIARAELGHVAVVGYVVIENIVVCSSTESAWIQPTISQITVHAVNLIWFSQRWM